MDDVERGNVEGKRKTGPYELEYGHGELRKEPEHGKLSKASIHGISSMDEQATIQVTSAHAPPGREVPDCVHMDDIHMAHLAADRTRKR